MPPTIVPKNKMPPGTVVCFGTSLFLLENPHRNGFRYTLWLWDQSQQSIRRLGIFAEKWRGMNALSYIDADREWRRQRVFTRRIARRRDLLIEETKPKSNWFRITRKDGKELVLNGPTNLINTLLEIDEGTCKKRWSAPKDRINYLEQLQALSISQVVVNKGIEVVFRQTGSEVRGDLANTGWIEIHCGGKYLLRNGYKATVNCIDGLLKGKPYKGQWKIVGEDEEPTDELKFEPFRRVHMSEALDQARNLS